MAVAVAVSADVAVDVALTITKIRMFALYAQKKQRRCCTLGVPKLGLLQILDETVRKNRSEFRLLELPFRGNDSPRLGVDFGPTFKRHNLNNL